MTQGSPESRRTLGFDGETLSGPSDSNCGSLELSIDVMVSIPGSPPERLVFGDAVGDCFQERLVVGFPAA